MVPVRDSSAFLTAFGAVLRARPRDLDGSPPLLEYRYRPPTAHDRPEGCAMLRMHRWNLAYHVAAGLSALVFAVVAPGCGGPSSVACPRSNPTSPAIVPNSDPAACRFVLAPSATAIGS